MSELLETIKLIKLGADWSDFALKKIDDVEKAVKAFEIIIKKNVDVEGFKEALNSAVFLQLETYNSWVRYDKERILTEEEFCTIREVFENDRG